MLKNAEGADEKGGDVVVLNANGGAGYNEYLWKVAKARNINVNSIVTLGFDPTDRATATRAASDLEVVKTLRDAEAIFMQGGDQEKYVSYWKYTGVGAVLLERTGDIGNLVKKQVTVGGTSAGMHVLSAVVYKSP